VTLSPGHPSLRFPIVEAIATVVEESGQRPLGRKLGIAGNTVAARGSDLHAWPLADGLDLGVLHAPLADAIVAYLRGVNLDAPAEPVAAISQGTEATKILIACVQVLVDVLDDRQITADEIPKLHRLEELVRELQPLLPIFLRNAKAAAGGNRDR
jgi:hypothetical protein